MINEFLNLLVLINGSDPRLLRSPQTSNRGKHFEVRSFEAFSFLDRHRLLPKKKIGMWAAILNYTNDGGPSFEAQNVAKRLVLQRPKRIGHKKTLPHIYL